MNERIKSPEEFLKIFPKEFMEEHQLEILEESRQKLLEELQQEFLEKSQLEFSKGFPIAILEQILRRIYCGISGKNSWRNP